jgi:hypothetical protein
LEVSVSKPLYAKAVVTVCAWLLLWGPSASATYIYIDTFTSPTQSLSTGAGGVATNIFQYTNSTVALGGEREVLLVRTNTTTGVPITSIVASSLSNGLTYATPANGLGYVRATYDGIDASTNLNFPGLGSFDLTDNGANTLFQIRAGADTTHSNGLIIVTVYSSATDYSRQVLAAPPVGTLASQFTNLFFSFAGMDNFGAGADFTDVNAIVLELNGLADAGIDMGLNLFVAVPEPGVFWLLGSVPILLLLRRRIPRKRA